MGGEGRVRGVSGLVFTACMFIGMGLGMLFGKTAVGLFLGMGVGFIFMALIKVRSLDVGFVQLSMPRSLHKLALAFLGIVLVLCGVLLISSPGLFWPYIVSLLMMTFGLILIVMSVWGLMSRRGETSL